MIGTSTLSFFGQDLREILEILSKDFRFIEIIDEGEVLSKSLSDTLESFKLSLSVHAPFSDLNIASFNERIRRESLNQLKECLEISSHLQAKVVTLHPGRFSPQSLNYPKKVFEVHLASLKELSKYAEEFSLTLGLENMPSYQFDFLLMKEPFEICEMLEAVSSDYLKFTLDIGHANINGNPFRFFSLEEEIAVIHLHDNHGESDEHIALGDGSINSEGMLKWLREFKNEMIIETYSYEDALKTRKILERYS
ncbi:MAG: sugar phosphate isomerase/epimerase family protein [Candidatus Methanofastidiosia archaeon]